MKTAILIKDMSVTTVESVLDEVVSNRADDDSLIVRELVPIYMVRDNVCSDDKAVSMDDLFLQDWGPLPPKGKVHTQYIAVEESRDDVEVILRQYRGLRSIIEISTDRGYDDYNNAYVHVYLEGPYGPMCDELIFLGVKLDNVESTVGVMPFACEFDAESGLECVESVRTNYINAHNHYDDSTKRLGSLLQPLLRNSQGVELDGLVVGLIGDSTIRRGINTISCSGIFYPYEVDELEYVQVSIATNYNEILGKVCVFNIAPDGIEMRAYNEMCRLGKEFHEASRAYQNLYSQVEQPVEWSNPDTTIGELDLGWLQENVGNVLANEELTSYLDVTHLDCRELLNAVKTDIYQTTQLPLPVVIKAISPQEVVINVDGKCVMLLKDNNTVGNALLDIINANETARSEYVSLGELICNALDELNSAAE